MPKNNRRKRYHSRSMPGVPSAQMLNAPWWCMFADHAPFVKEADYVDHMRELHGVDFKSGRYLARNSRAWQCGDASHSPYASEQLFLEHLQGEHGLVQKLPV